MLLLLILLLLWPIDVVVVNIVVVVVNIVVVVIDIVVVVVLLVWPVHLCEDLLRSAVTIGTKHLVHSLNNPENIKIWNMEINIEIWNMKMNIKIWSIKMLKHLVHSLNNPENIFLYVAGLILSSNIHPWLQHIVNCLCVSPSISSISWSSSTQSYWWHASWIHQGLTLSSPDDQWCRSHRHRTFETPSAISPPRFLSIVMVALENYYVWAMPEIHVIRLF